MGSRVHIDTVNIYYTQNSPGGIDVSAKFDAIMRAMEEENSVIDSMLVLVDQLASDSISPEETDQILKEMAAKRQAVADALLKNTRAATVEQNAPTPDAATTPGMTTGNNEPASSGDTVGGVKVPGSSDATPDTTGPTTESTGGAGSVPDAGGGNPFRPNG